MGQIAKRIRTTARGLDLVVEPKKRVVVLYGPNGGGKSTFLHSIMFALRGTIVLGGEPVKAVQDVFRTLSPGPGDIRARIEYESGHYVDRTARGRMKGDKLSVEQRVLTSLADADAGGERAATAAIVAALGDPAQFDVAGFLSLGPTARQKRLMEMCAASAPPWPASRVIAMISALAEATYEEGMAGKVTFAAWGPDAQNPGATDDDLFNVQADETFYAALVRHMKAAQARADANAAEIERTQKAIERLDADAAQRTQQVHGTIEQVDAEIRRLNTEIERGENELGQARTLTERRQSIQGEIATVEALVQRPVPEYEADIGRAEASLADAVAQLAEAEATTAPTFAPDAELAPLRAAREEKAARAAELDTNLAGLAAQIEAFRATEQRLAAHDGDDPAECPMCLQAIDGRVAEVITAHRGSLERLAQAATGALADLRAELSRLDIDIAEIEEDDRQRQLEVARSTATRAERITSLRAQVAEGGPLRRGVQTAREALAARRGADERLAALRQSLAELAVVDLEATERALDGARQQREQAAERRRLISEAQQRRETRLRAVADRDAAEQRTPILKAAVEVWQRLVNDYVREALAPMAETINRMAPDDATFTIDVDRAEFRVSKGAKPAFPLVSLSDGEQVLFFPAVSTAFARQSGAGWRVLLADRADGIQSLPARGAPHGVFVRFVAGIVAAADAGEIDQAFICTARLTNKEEMVLADLGVQIVRVGFDDEAPAVEAPPADDDGAARALADSLTTAGLRTLYERIGAEMDPSVPIARASLAAAARARGYTAAALERLASGLPRRKRAEEAQEEPVPA